MGNTLELESLGKLYIRATYQMLILMNTLSDQEKLDNDEFKNLIFEMIDIKSGLLELLSIQEYEVLTKLVHEECRELIITGNIE